MNTFSEGDLKVWYIPQVPMEPYEVPVPDIQTAKVVLDAVVGLSIFEFENRVKPDYADAVGIARWESDGDGGFDWFDLEESEYEVES